MKIIVSTEEIYMLTFELVYRYEVAVGTTPGGGQIKPFFSVPVNTQYYTVTGLALDGLTKVKKKKRGSLSNCRQIKPFFSVPVDTQYYTVTGLAFDSDKMMCSVPS